MPEAYRGRRRCAIPVVPGYVFMSRMGVSLSPGANAALAGVVFFAAAALACAQTNLSVWTFPGSSGRVLTQPDALGNRIPDYSGVGYRGGTTPIPSVPVKITLSPVAGDDGATIQAAINTVKALPLDTNGFRGAILLNAGEYQIAGSLTMDASGIVLRGRTLHPVRHRAGGRGLPDSGGDQSRAAVEQLDAADHGPLQRRRVQVHRRPGDESPATVLSRGHALNNPTGTTTNHETTPT